METRIRHKLRDDLISLGVTRVHVLIEELTPLHPLYAYAVSVTNVNTGLAVGLLVERWSIREELTRVVKECVSENEVGYDFMDPGTTLVWDIQEDRFFVDKLHGKNVTIMVMDEFAEGERGHGREPNITAGG